MLRNEEVSVWDTGGVPRAVAFGELGPLPELCQPRLLLVPLNPSDEQREEEELKGNLGVLLDMLRFTISFHFSAFVRKMV